MKDIAFRDLPIDQDRASVAPAPARPDFEAWLAQRPALWTIGRDLQLEIYRESTAD